MACEILKYATYLTDIEMVDSRYNLVDSLYGPGTVGAWLLTICATSISWTFNKSSRRNDTISVDFIAALLLPLIAAGHLVFLLIRLPVSVAEIITARDVELQQYESAIEAPLNICETFSVVALFWAVLCGPWWHSTIKLRRLGPVVVTGLFSWAMENVMFAMATMKGVSVTETTLSRPYLFLTTTIVAITWAFLILCVTVGCFTWIIISINERKAQKNTGQQDAAEIRREWVMKVAQLKALKKPDDPNDLTREAIDQMHAQLEQIERAMQSSNRSSETSFRSLEMITFVTLFFLPLSTISSFMFTFDSFTAMRMNAPALNSHQFILIPQSEVSMSSLDQIAALIGGVIVLLAAIRSAYRSRLDKQSALRIIERRRSI